MEFSLETQIWFTSASGAVLGAHLDLPEEEEFQKLKNLSFSKINNQEKCIKNHKIKCIVPKALLESLSVHFPRRRPDMLRHLRLHRHGYRRTMITLFISLPNSNRCKIHIELFCKIRHFRVAIFQKGVQGSPVNQTKLHRTTLLFTPNLLEQTGLSIKFAHNWWYPLYTHIFTCGGAGL